MGGGLSRRRLLAGAAGAGLAGLLPAAILSDILSGCSSPEAPAVFDSHQTAVITEATARLVPGPLDDPTEAGHPGAREADVARYIATLIGAMSYRPARVFAGGPFSGRGGEAEGHHGDEMARFVEPNPALAANWRGRLAVLHAAYVQGIAQLDAEARRRGRAGFAEMTAAGKDAVLTANPATPGLPAGYGGFTDLLFEHTIEGLYSVPEYGGNAGLVGWRDIGFPGDVQPRGYTDAEVSSPLDTRPYTPAPIVARLLQLLESTAPPPPSPALGSA